MDEPRDVQGHEEKTMERFERELSAAMQRVDAPRSLAVFLENAAEAEAARQQSGRKMLWFKPKAGGRILAVSHPRQWMGGAIAAVLVLGCFGAVSAIHVRNEERQAAAQREFAQAEQITDRALEHAREQMQKAGVSLDGQE